MSRTVGIFKSDDGAFLGVDASDFLEEVDKAIAEFAPIIPAPPQGTRCRHVGDLTFGVAAVEDEATYKTASPRTDHVAKPRVGRKPSSDSGSWSIQSIIFDSDKFTAETASRWLKDNDFYGDDAENTSQSIRYRQYDPEHFTMFRTKRLADGVTAVVGRVKAAEEKSGSESDIENAVSIYHGIRAINRAISKEGVRMIAHSEVQKADGEEERFVLGIVLEPTIGKDIDTRPDTQKDVYTAEEIRKACHGWMERGGLVDLKHSWAALKSDQIVVVENYLAPCDMEIAQGDEMTKVLKGTWLTGLKVRDDTIWKKCKSGEIGAFSIGGEAKRSPLEERSANA